jgi:hypothetical protein
VKPPDPELNPEEKLLKMAESLPTAAQIASEDKTLSPDEVEKLLNG